MNIKKITTVFTIVFLSFGTYSAKAQSLSKKDKDRVQIYTPEERDNIQLWFHDQIKQMGLSEEVEEQYFGIMLRYSAKIKRLDDKDKGLTKGEIKKDLEEYIEKQEAEIKEVLTARQYNLHLKSYGAIMRSVYKRWGIDSFMS